MRTATITETKNGLSALIDEVRAGQTILILDRGIPVARLEPATLPADPLGRLARLARAGVIRPARTGMPLDLARLPGPEVGTGASAVEALLEERRTGR